MKRKFADFPTMERAIKKEYINIYIENEEFKGNMGVLKLIEVSEPKIVKEKGKELTIIDNNYKWLEIYPDNYKAAMSVLYNEKDDILEWYFDVVKDTGVENGVPYIDDLYLDVVVLKDGKIILLDEDELKQALEEKDISQEDYNQAYEIAYELMERLDGNLEELIKFSNKYYKMIANN